MQTRSVLLAFLTALSLVASSCASTETASKSTTGPSLSTAQMPSSTAAGVAYINFEHDRFVPATVTVPAGTTVSWQVSEDYAHHWVVCEKAPFHGWFYEWFPFNYEFTEPGVYPYHDGADPSITGTVTVY